jgi:hypothetical protein
MKTIIEAYDVFLDDTEGMAGQVLETSAGNFCFRKLPEPLDDVQTEMWSDMARLRKLNAR